MPAAAESGRAHSSHATLVLILRALRRLWCSSRWAFAASALMIRVQLDTTAHWWRCSRTMFKTCAAQSYAAHHTTYTSCKLHQGETKNKTAGTLSLRPAISTPRGMRLTTRSG